MIALTVSIQFAQAEKALSHLSKKDLEKVLTLLSSCAIHLVGKTQWEAALSATPKI